MLQDIAIEFRGEVLAGNELDKEFIERQKSRLLERKLELERMRDGVREDERDRSQEEQDTQFDSGDESQYMFTREMDATLGQQFDRQLEEVNRALEKIEEGTYGLSDDTGEPIPKGRLEAIPEALYTVEAQERRERERRPPI
jgi:RNA polymerase-binding transcription factor